MALVGVEPTRNARDDEGRLAALERPHPQPLSQCWERGVQPSIEGTGGTRTLTRAQMSSQLHHRTNTLPSPSIGRGAGGEGVRAQRALVRVCVVLRTPCPLAREMNPL